MLEVLHVGLQKCASTYLQKVAFAQHPEIAVFTSQHVKAQILQLQENPWDLDVGALKADVARVVAQEGSDGRVPVLSYERLSGRMHTGEGGRLTLEACQEMFDRPKVLLILRNPYRLAYSLWNQYVQEGGTLSLKDYLSTAGPPTYNSYAGVIGMRDGTGVRPGSLFSRLLYDRLAAYLHDTFGPERVLILFVEDMGRDFDAFIESIYTFIGVDPTFRPENVRLRGGYSHGLANLLRLINVFSDGNYNQFPWRPIPFATRNRRIRRVLNAVNRRYVRRKRSPDVRPYIPGNVREEIRRSNAALGERIGRDLAELGIDV